MTCRDRTNDVNFALMYHHQSFGVKWVSNPNDYHKQHKFDVYNSSDGAPQRKKADFNMIDISQYLLQEYPSPKYIRLKMRAVSFFAK